MLELKNVSKYYDNQKVLENISLKLPDVGLFLIKGKSGIGKTTLFNLISHLDSPTNGDICYNSKSYKEMKENDIANLRKEIGFIFQDSNLINNLTIKDNLELVKLIAKTNIDIIEVLNKLGIANVINKYPNILSGGEKQRVAIAIALIKDAKIILADEPTSNLDEETRKEVFKILEEISKERLVLIVSHDSYLIENIKNNILLSDLFNNNYDFSNNLVINKKKNYNKINPLNYLKYSLKLIKKSKLLYLFSLLFFWIISFISILLFTAYFNGESKQIKNLFSSYDIDKVVLYDKMYNSFYYKDFADKMDLEDNTIYYTKIDKRDLSYGIVIDNSIKDNEIYIDEGLKEVFLADGLIDDYQIKLAGITFTITKIYNYKHYDSNSVSMSYTFNNSLYLNAKSFLLLNDEETMKDYYGAYFINSNYQPCTDNYIISERIYYDLNLKDDEIIMPDFTKNEFSSGDIVKVFDDNYKIVEFSNDSTTFFSENVFANIVAKYSYTLFNNATFIGKEYKINDDTIEFITKNRDNLGNEKYNIDSPLANDISKILSFHKQTVGNTLLVIYPIVIFVVILMVIFIFYSFYRNYKKDMGFVLSLGSSKMKLIFVYFTPLLTVTLLALCLGSIVELFVIKPLNNIILEILFVHSYIELIRFDILAVFTTFGILLACFIICFIILNIIFIKKKTINIIYDR